MKESAVLYDDNYDKLAKSKPYITAQDLEKKLQLAKETVKEIQQVDFDLLHLDDSSLIKSCSETIKDTFYQL